MKAVIKTRRKTKDGESDFKHPYLEYEGTPMWGWVRKGIRDLVNNKDLIEQEDQRYIVGYICKVISQGQSKAKAKSRAGGCASDNA